MDKLESVRNMQDYIDKHIDERITLNDLAKVSLYSVNDIITVFGSYKSIKKLFLNIE